MKEKDLTLFYLLCQPIVFWGFLIHCKKIMIVPTECWPSPPPPYIFHPGEGRGGGHYWTTEGEGLPDLLGKARAKHTQQALPNSARFVIHLPFFWTQTKSVNELKGRTPGTLDKLIGQIRARALNPRWSLSSPLC